MDDAEVRGPGGADVACTYHPNKPALLRCSRCESPICADDAIEAPVGYQCPRCARGGSPVRRLGDVSNATSVTRALVITVAVIFVGTELARRSGVDVLGVLGLRPVAVAVDGPAMMRALFGASAPASIETPVGQPWLLFTSALLHANLLHVAFNGLLLWQLGQLLEPRLGRGRFAALVAAGAAGGALGITALAWFGVATGTAGGWIGEYLGANPFISTVGASGAVFGLMGAAMVGLSSRGTSPWSSGIGGLVALNLVLTFVIPSVSVGGHLGGLAGGALAGRMLFVDRERAVAATRRVWVLTAAAFVLSAVLANLTVAGLSTG